MADLSNLPLFGKLSQQSIEKGENPLYLQNSRAFVNIPKTPRGE